MYSGGFGGVRGVHNYQYSCSDYWQNHNIKTSKNTQPQLFIFKEAEIRGKWEQITSRSSRFYIKVLKCFSLSQSQQSIFFCWITNAQKHVPHPHFVYRSRFTLQLFPATTDFFVSINYITSFGMITLQNCVWNWETWLLDLHTLSPLWEKFQKIGKLQTYPCNALWTCLHFSLRMVKMSV